MSNLLASYGPKHFYALNDKVRHGFEEEYNSDNFLDSLANSFYIYYDDKRHNTNGNPVSEEMKRLSEYSKNYQPITDWKVMRERQKTINAVIVLCLNLGVDPPDIMKTYPCAKYEAWCDPTQYPDMKRAIEMIGRNLQSQYETLSLRTRYRQSLDPCVEDVKRFCNTLRRNAKDERILFHYNGHGVPQPTSSGEIWVFNRGFTQYIPISLYDLQTWIGAPVIFVYDCSNAGNIVHNFKKFAQKRIDDDNEGNHDFSAPSPSSAYLDCIQLAACKSNEILPMNPELPADLFTSCLTCPIEISIMWFIMLSPLKKTYYDMLPKNSVGNVTIPGKLTDRRTALGELNWIFTAITDTIAWTSLPRPIFKRLFRQDLMVAALFRNFLLAKRIMLEFDCEPISDPPLPDTIRYHHMWDSWDLAIDQVFAHLVKNLNPDVYTGAALNVPMSGRDINPQSFKDNVSAPYNNISSGQQNGNLSQLSNYQHSSFFEQQLTAFEIWLKYVGSCKKEPPEQLPIVLQVLLSHVHRLRALVLLSKFLDLGPWAVYLALSIGIFPYVLKLLLSPAQELKPVLIFIWARIMAIDYKSTQQELCKDKGYNYFYSILNPNAQSQVGSEFTSCMNFYINDDHKAMCAFILTLFMKDFRTGQRLCFSVGLINNCLEYISTSENPLLRQWCYLLLSQLWFRYPDGKWIIYKDGHLNRLLLMIVDPIPEVRTSIVLALTNFLSSTAEYQQELLSKQSPLDQPASHFQTRPYNSGSRRDEIKQQDLTIANAILTLLGDGSSMVRKEIVFFMNRFVSIYSKFFLVVAFNQLEEEILLIENPNNLSEFRKRSPAYGSIFSSLWKGLLILTEDPHLEVKQLAETLIDSIMISLNKSELSHIVKEMQEYLLNKSTININYSFKTVNPIVNRSLRSQESRNNISSGPMIERNKNTLAINGSLTGRRNVSTSFQRKQEDDKSSSGSDADSFTSKLKNLSISRIFKSLKINEDNDLHTFRRILNPGPVPSSYGAEYKPKPPRFRPRDLSRSPELPSESGFFEYSCEYFQDPQMSKSEVDEPGSAEYVKRLWRRNRNENIIQETQPQKSLALTGEWGHNLAVINNVSQPKLVKFTQFEKALVASDEKDNISVWDWQSKKLVKKFSNCNPFGTKITEMKFLNEDDLPLLLTGSSDGIIKIYKNFHTPEADESNQVQLISAWRALTDLLLTSKSSGLISEWQQSRGSLLVSGDVKVIRVWDAPRELCIVDIPARSTSSITSLTSDQLAGNIIVAGFDDGSLRVYDRRLDSRDSMVKLWRNTKRGPRSASNGSLRNVHMQRGGFRELVSGSADGFINIWDIRNDDPVLTFNNQPERDSLRCLDVHEHAPIIASGSKTSSLWTTSGDLLTSLRNPHETYLSNRTSNYLSNLSFHPHKMMLAVNYNQDSHINLYTCEDTFNDF